MDNPIPEELFKRISACGVMAVIMIDDAEAAVPLAQALAAGGVKGIELTLRTPAALEAIKRIRAGCPDVLVGAGTVLNRTQVEQVKAAGAQFGVSPGCNPSTLRAAREVGLPFAPGVATASDVEIAVENGCRLLKFFPAETCGGLPHLAAMAAPFAHLGLKYIPLGGISAAELGAYLASPHVACVGGSWLAKSDVIRARDWKKISDLAAAAMAIVKTHRSP
ncbi:MAG TPA: bifunctional 4-hydroxy-2-oxoglutarate aldolase/2-dehydro-3-deoxy-phosphogluconate aldolase [Candidatus Didemnitutus sp.]|nr:bifunctional 4-hydroxy-2-oxoglutarate aldolase/2-dehydro-3-deoxy-phosphogluconate aldolase [Candidatus Didemnitutus sp.]